MILKRKIHKAKQALYHRGCLNSSLSQSSPRLLKHLFSLKTFSGEVSLTDPHSLKHKNIFKNYGRAICNFIVSNIGEEYSTLITDRLKVTMEQIKNYVHQSKENLNGSQGFLEFFLKRENDSAELLELKEAVARLGIIFIKYFSVNWIIHSKLLYKLDYLKCRSKILKMIQLSRNNLSS